MTGLVRGLATVLVTVLTSERTGDSISYRTCWDCDKTSDMSLTEPVTGRDQDW